MDIGQLKVGKGYFMVTVGQQGLLKENLTELHIIVRTTGECLKHIIFKAWRHEHNTSNNYESFLDFLTMHNLTMLVPLNEKEQHTIIAQYNFLYLF